jgi:hypothetical protein
MIMRRSLEWLRNIGVITDQESVDVPESDGEDIVGVVEEYWGDQESGVASTDRRLRLTAIMSVLLLVRRLYLLDRKDEYKYNIL